MTTVRIRTIEDLDGAREQLVRPEDYHEISLELQRRQDPPNDQWCVGCTPIGDGSNEICGGCGPIGVEVADVTTYFSFGFAHHHEVGGRVLDRNTVARVTAPNPRSVMFAVFGQEWSFSYDERPDHPLMRYLPVFDVKLADDGSVEVAPA